MQYREVAWAQQLYFQRLLHGPAAEVTERSYPNYPATAMREIIRQSEHPHNVEPLLLTLRRPQNSATRQRFAEAAGELVLIEKVLNASPLATDFKMAVHGRIVDAADGILYPTQSCNTKYETWLRTEMLDVLRMMLEEGLLQRQQHLGPLVEAGVAPLLVAAVQQAWQELLARSAFTYTPPAKKPAAQEAEGDAEQSKEEESEEQQELRAKAEEAVAAANMTFEENWQLFLKTVYDTELVPGYARAALQLGCGLLQLLAHEGVEGQLPPRELLQQLASYSQEPLLSTTGRILLAGTAADADAPVAAGADASTAIVALPQHQHLELAEFFRLCHACNKPEDAAVKLLKCSACGCVSYCCSGCQKADWKAGHKQVCKDLAASRAKLAAA
ncbi:hypothetical protein OEZ86_014648 [Tetradesmus obliquus]|nr:hypothetical protein OEZ86_014648 [Tetradesmus obliquus]